MPPIEVSVLQDTYRIFDRQIWNISLFHANAIMSSAVYGKHFAGSNKLDASLLCPVLISKSLDAGCLSSFTPIMFHVIVFYAISKSNLE